MDIIFLTGDGRQRFQLSLGSLSALLAAGVLLGTGLFVAGARYGVGSVVVPPTGAVSLWHRDLALQEADVSEAIRAGEDGLDALARKLGQLQAEMMRIEAVGERVVREAQLDPDEFSFGEPPALGGPAPTLATSNEVPDFLTDLRLLEERLADRRPKLDALATVLTNRELRSKITPSGRPVRKGWLSSGYGYRRDPVSGRRDFHSGVDFAAPAGSTVVAAAAGIVSVSERKVGYGNVVSLVHGEGYVTRYAHNAKNLVAVGQVVAKGEPIAVVGSTGRSTGTHVHYEVLVDGKTVDAAKFTRAAR